MLFRPIPRQQPYCSARDFRLFLKMVFQRTLFSGKNIALFESSFAGLFNRRFALSAGSCRSAFALIIDALGIGPGDEVILPAFNLPAFPKILKLKGIIPVFVDIDQDTLTIDPDQIERNITPKTKAIVVVHLFGNTCDMDRILPIANKYQIKVIEDCANAYRTCYKGRYVGTFGDVACFSFGPSKDISVFGGGMIVTNNEQLFSSMQQGYDEEFTFPRIGQLFKLVLKNLVYKIATLRIVFLLFVFPVARLCYLMNIDFVGLLIEEKDKDIKFISKHRLTNFQALIGLEQLRNDRKLRDKRVQNAKIYNDLLEGLEGIILSRSIEGGDHGYWNYVIQVERRKEMVSRLIAHGIDGKIIDAYDCNQFRIFTEFRKSCPVSSLISQKLLALPVYPPLTEYDICFIGHVLSKGRVRVREKQKAIPSC